MSTQALRVFTVLVTFLLAAPANAFLLEWNYTGAISDCNPALCDLVSISAGDPVTGAITIDVVNGGGMFTLPAGFADFGFLVAGAIPVSPVSGDPPAGVVLTGGGTYDALFNFTGGALLGEFVGGTLGGLGGAVDINLATGELIVTIGFGAAFVASVAGEFVPKQPVPVPAAIWFLGSGLLGLAGWRQRKNA